MSSCCDSRLRARASVLKPCLRSAGREANENRLWFYGAGRRRRRSGGCGPRRAQRIDRFVVRERARCDVDVAFVDRLRSLSIPLRCGKSITSFDFIMKIRSTSAAGPKLQSTDASSHRRCPCVDPHARSRRSRRFGRVDLEQRAGVRGRRPSRTSSVLIVRGDARDARRLGVSRGNRWTYANRRRRARTALVCCSLFVSRRSAA